MQIDKRRAALQYQNKVNNAQGHFFEGAIKAVCALYSERERVLGDYSPGRFAWVLQNPVMFDKPIPARGKQGWWNWEGDAE